MYHFKGKVLETIFQLTQDVDYMEISFIDTNALLILLPPSGIWPFSTFYVEIFQNNGPTLVHAKQPVEYQLNILVFCRMLWLSVYMICTLGIFMSVYEM